MLQNINKRFCNIPYLFKEVEMKDLSLYIHIPFCVRKCHYCDFLSAPCDENTRQNYVEALCREITQRAEDFKDKKVDTIFFGGGTPSILSIEQITRIMSTVREKFQILPKAEISLEMNPGTVERKKLEVYKKLGINRLSIGLQSADNEELKVLGRIHTWESFLQTWEMVREAGFTNVNIDLMSALPGQTLESYENTLKKVLALKPEHISAYSLIIEEGTRFYEWYGKEEENYLEGKWLKKEGSFEERRLPDEVVDRQMYELTKKLLEEKGYKRYEISNYALEGYECKHNIGYWKRKEYLGLGLGAASLLYKKNEKDFRIGEENARSRTKEKVKNIRCSNISDLETYLKKTQNMKEESLENMQKEKNKNRELWMQEYEEVSVTEQMEEFMFLGLRMMEGISSAEFEQQFGKSLQEVYGKQIQKLVQQELLEYWEENGRYALTLKGIDVSNQVFVEFIN